MGLNGYGSMIYCFMLHLDPGVVKAKNSLVAEYVRLLKSLDFCTATGYSFYDIIG